MQLKRQSVEVWQNEKHYSQGNNTSENPITRQETFKPVDHVKYEGQVRSGQVRSGQVRSGQVRSQHLLFVKFFSLSFQAVVLRTKTAVNHRFFFQSSLR